MDKLKRNWHQKEGKDPNPYSTAKDSESYHWYFTACMTILHFVNKQKRHL